MWRPSMENLSLSVPDLLQTVRTRKYCTHQKIVTLCIFLNSCLSFPRCKLSSHFGLERGKTPVHTELMLMKYYAPIHPLSPALVQHAWVSILFFSHLQTQATALYTNCGLEPQASFGRRSRISSRLTSTRPSTRCSSDTPQNSSENSRYALLGRTCFLR